MAYLEKQSSTPNEANTTALQTRVGIIGLGHMGGYHASVCSSIPHVALAAIADPNTSNWKKVTHPSVTRSRLYTDWLDEVDAVIIAVPTDLHYEVTKACLEAGKHVLLEKPLTKSIAEAEELFELAAKKNCALHVGHVERYNGAVQELKKIIREPHLIESQRIGPFAPRVQKDSVILDLMIHDLDIIIGLVNSKVVAMHPLGRQVSTPLPDIAIVQIAFANGVIANITSSRASQIKRRTMSIHQEDAFIQLDFTTQDISIHRHTSTSVQVGNSQLRYKQESMVERLFVYKENPLKLEVETFIEAVRSGENLADPEQDLEALKVTLELEEIVLSG